MTQDYFIIGLQEMAEAVCRALVTYPDDLHVLAYRNEDHVRVIISDFPRCDYGKLLGAKQTTFTALRVLFQTYGEVRNEKVELTVAEPIVDKPEIVVGDDPQWNDSKSSQLALLVAQMMETVGDYTGTVSAIDTDEPYSFTKITVRSRRIDPKLATAISKLIRSAARMKGRRVEFRAEKV